MVPELLDWERVALARHLDLGQLVTTTLEVRVDKATGTGSAWLVVAFYAPDIWKRWHVGLVHGSLNLYADLPVELPDPVRFTLPSCVRESVGEVLAERWAEVEVCPVIVAGRALGFVIRKPSSGRPDICETFAPTHLSSRLGLEHNNRIKLQLIRETGLHLHSHP